MHASPKKRSSCDHDGAGGKTPSLECLESLHALSTAAHDQSSNGTLYRLKTRVILDEGARGSTIESSIALCTRGPYRGPFASVEHSELEHRKIGRTPHDSAKCIDFPDDRALCNPTDGGIAGHLADCLQCACDKSDSRTNASCSDCRLGSGVATTYYEDVEIGFG
jgi:hypothetical protein